MPRKCWDAVMDAGVDNGGYVTAVLVPTVPAVELRKVTVGTELSTM